MLKIKIVQRSAFGRCQRLNNEVKNYKPWMQTDAS